MNNKKTNKIGKVMGSTMKRPPGSKAAKNERMRSNKSSVASQASTIDTKRVDALNGLQLATNRMALSIQFDSQHKALMDQAKMCQQMGDMVSCKECLDQAKALSAENIAAVKRMEEANKEEDDKEEDVPEEVVVEDEEEISVSSSVANNNNNKDSDSNSDSDSDSDPPLETQAKGITEV